MYLIAELCNMISMQKIWNLSWIPFAVCIKMQENDELNQGFLTSAWVVFWATSAFAVQKYPIHWEMFSSMVALQTPVVSSPQLRRKEVSHSVVSDFVTQWTVTL